eukprot:5108328-Amphidinium_carterae.2
MAKHFEEVDEDVASYAASQPKWTNRAKLCWRKDQNREMVDREAPGPESRLPTVAEEKASDASLETMGAADPEAFGRPGLDGRTIFTSTLKAILGGTQKRGKVLGVPTVAFTGWYFTEDREHAVGVPGFSRDQE